MTDTRANFTEFVTRRLESFRDCTGMWGGLEAVELQAMQLVEVEAFLAGVDRENKRIAIETWCIALQVLEGRRKNDKGGVKPFHYDPPLPLHVFIPEGEPSNNKFGPALFELAQKVRRKLGLLREENALERLEDQAVADVLDGKVHVRESSEEATGKRTLEGSSYIPWVVPEDATPEGPEDEDLVAPI